MKTITLSEEAYERLKDWKESSHDSFSAVVLRRVAKRGTLGALAAALAGLPPLADEEYRAWMETRDADRASERERDPWTPLPTRRT